MRRGRPVVLVEGPSGGAEPPSSGPALDPDPLSVATRRLTAALESSERVEVRLAGVEPAASADLVLSCRPAAARTRWCDAGAVFGLFGSGVGMPDRETAADLARLDGVFALGPVAAAGVAASGLGTAEILPVPLPDVSVPAHGVGQIPRALGLLVDGRGADAWLGGVDLAMRVWQSLEPRPPLTVLVDAASSLRLQAPGLTLVDADDPAALGAALACSGFALDLARGRSDPRGFVPTALAAGVPVATTRAGEVCIASSKSPDLATLEDPLAAGVVPIETPRVVAELASARYRTNLYLHPADTVLDTVASGLQRWLDEAAAWADRASATAESVRNAHSLQAVARRIERFAFAVANRSRGRMRVGTAG